MVLAGVAAYRLGTGLAAYSLLSQRVGLCGTTSKGGVLKVEAESARAEPEGRESWQPVLLSWGQPEAAF